MAVIWQKTENEDHYEVRTAGNSLRLYKNGVFHSQWNAQRPLSNGVWDLLFLPALFLPEGDVKRVLLLGVGGGAVINQFTTLLKPQKIVGVELDPVHLQVAKSHFLVDQQSVELCQADAIDWLKAYRGEKFDFIIEDLFTEEGGEPVRVAAATTEWFRLLLKNLQRQGTLVINFEGKAQMRESSESYLAAKGARPDVRYQLNQPTYGNSVCAYMGQPVSPATLRRNLDNLLSHYPDCRAGAQRFQLRKVILPKN